MASERDVQDIINTLIAEGVGEGEEGMRRIAETILNRAEQRGISPAEVVRQRSQYTGYAHPGPGAVRAQHDPSAISAAQAAWNLAQGPDDPTGGANHYFNPNVVLPTWASSMTPTGEFGNHAFYTDRVPKPIAPVPATPSIDMAQMRRISAPTQLIRETFDAIPRRGDGTANLGDEIAMSPIQGGRQQAPMFDAAYDDRTGEMRLTRQPIDSQGIAVGRSHAPAPVPAIPSPQLAARRATDATLQAALNARYPAQLPALPPPIGPAPATRQVATTTVRPSTSDLVRGNPMQTMEQATTIASIPTRPSASDLARGRSGISTVAAIPTTSPQVAQASIPGPAGYFNPNKGAERLATAPATAPGDALLASLGIVEPPRIAQAPFPRPRPDFLPQVATALDVVPMPPMPVPRPPMFANARTTPIPQKRPGLFGFSLPSLPSIPREMQTVAGRTAAMEPPMRQVMTGSPSRPTLTSAVAAQRGSGVSAQQAYNRTNSASVERAIANSSNPAAARRLNERLGNI